MTDRLAEIKENFARSGLYEDLPDLMAADVRWLVEEVGRLREKLTAVSIEAVQSAALLENERKARAHDNNPKVSPGECG